MKIADIAMQSIAVMGFAFTALALEAAPSGETNLGHVLGVGCAVNLDANPRIPLPRTNRIACLGS